MRTRSNSTAQFLDWVKKPMPGWGIYEYYRREAEKLRACEPRVAGQPRR